MTHFWLIAALVISTPGLGVRSSAARDVPALTLEQAVAIALDGHPSLRAAEFGIVAARERRGEARAAYYPDLSANAGYARWERHAFLPDGISSQSIASAIGPTDDWFAGLSGRYLLFDSGARAARVRGALAGERIAAADAAQLRQDLVLSVHEAFHGLAAAWQARQVAGEDRARADEHVRLAEARKAAGAVPGGDIIRARVAASEAGLRVISAEHLVAVAAGRLNTAMGLPADTPVRIEPGALRLERPDDSAAAAALARALTRRPALASAAARVDSARSALDAARAEFGPRIGADWRLGWRDSAWWPQDRDWSAGVTVGWPLFTGFARERARGRARAELGRAEATLRAEELQIGEEVWAARSRLDETFEAARAADALVADAGESLRVARERYRFGAGTVADLLDTQAALARASAARVSAWFDYRTAQAAFLRATGELGPR